jgi:hypothetical protein
MSELLQHQQSYVVFVTFLPVKSEGKLFFWVRKVDDASVGFADSTAIYSTACKLNLENWNTFTMSSVPKKQPSK